MLGDFNRAILEQMAHRPWPPPREPWVMTQTWHDLLFAHWPVSVARLRPLVPDPLAIDLHEGQAWVGLVSFRMTNVGLRSAPPLPFLSAFPELNLRTYVSAHGRAGVYFFSLDAGSAIAAAAARLLLRLPYFPAAMRVERSGEEVRYESRRTASPPAEFAARYAPAGPVFNAASGSLEHFLTERYGLFAMNHVGRPYRLDIHHPPWPLQAAVADIQRNTVASAAGIELPPTPPVLHFVHRQDMVAWAPRGVTRG